MTTQTPHTPSSSLAVAVIAAEGELTPQAVRLLAGLQDDPRFRVSLHRAPASVRALPFPVSLESRILPVPRRNPLPRVRKDLLGEAPPGATGQAEVVIDLSGGFVPETDPKHGLWRIVDLPGEGPLHAGLAGATACRVALARWPSGGDAPRLVAVACYDTKPLASLSIAYAAEKSAQVILRELARCQRDGHPADLGPLPGAAPAPRGAAAYALRSTRALATRLGQRLAERRGRMPQPFELRIGRGSATDFDPASAVRDPLPPDGLRADPFLIGHEGATWCFFEEVDPAVGHGHVGVGRVTEAGLVDVVPALRRPHHMSYPFVFHHRSELWMMPEVHAAGRLEIWRCTRFPDSWELCVTAFEGTPVADSVLYRRGDEWWLFTHLCRDSFGDYCSDLYLFRVDGPELTRIEPHPLNPVVTDAATARGGGRVMDAGGRILRLSQDNSGGPYGWGLNVMEITRLDLSDYEERRLRHVTPDFAPGLTGCHHFDAAGGWFVIDARRT